ncbi:chemotaxis regulator [Aquitalea magnusonii]|jgi:two-component system chemotaxis response regulator CheY|uniref:Chemotaxis regulator n=1 Tax=Aquitalea magnusonii TaxID=332411 RepID=A0A3G9G8J4_9NEIS|nr:response regulator [Aquitalea magnusonii]BBF83895.1 chemotaxis regulator [Aquitalea magnusonii]
MTKNGCHSRINDHPPQLLGVVASLQAHGKHDKGGNMSKTILIVDDSTSLRLVIKMTLEGAGHHVIQAADGQQALAMLEQHRIDLIITDLNMPVLDGFGLLDHIRQHPSHRQIPVVMLTTQGAPHLQQLGQQKGGCSWIVKPFEPSHLLAVVARLTQR